MSKDVAELTAADWRADRPTKIVIHGFGNNVKSQIFLTLVPGSYTVRKQRFKFAKVSLVMFSTSASVRNKSI